MNNISVLDGFTFAKMVKSGCNNLRTHMQTVNNLNVFPIPDGDTGSNMLMTIIGGADNAGAGTKSISETSRRISDGMLLSARGNSGVILSQIFEGIAGGFEGMEEAGNQEIIKALQTGVRHSYRAVMDPCEGTMLTVMRCACEYAGGKAAPSIRELFSNFLYEAKRTLEKTPDMLPVLKKAGVVDSGGAGLVYIFEGMLGVLTGEQSESDFQTVAVNDDMIDLNLFTEDSVLKYGYCTELLLRLQNCKTEPGSFDVATLTEYLKGIGDSVVAFKTGSIVKIHIHTMTPDRVLAFCQRYGEFLKIKIENMSLQHNSAALEGINVTVKPQGERKAYAVVTVASGDGIKKLFSERGADVIVDGGQTMNPSAEDFLQAFNEANADTIFVLPNNSNIILTAKQAAGIYTDSEIYVLESKTIGDGYAAISMLSTESGNTKQIVQEMTDAMQNVVTACISKSIKDTDEVRAGDYIGFVGKNILSAKENRLDAVKSTADALGASEYDICLIIRGKSTDEAEALLAQAYVKSKCPLTETYLIDGMQDIYDYILILE